LAYTVPSSHDPVRLQKLSGECGGRSGQGGEHCINKERQCSWNLEVKDPVDQDSNIHMDKNISNLIWQKENKKYIN